MKFGGGEDRVLKYLVDHFTSNHLFRNVFVQKSFLCFLISSYTASFVLTFKMLKYQKIRHVTFIFFARSYLEAFHFLL